MNESVPLLISITEISDFLRCRRMWDLSSPNRQALYKKGTPSPALHLGTAVHHGLAAHAFGQNPIVALDEWYDSELKRIAQEYVEAVGVALSPSERNELLTAKELAQGMLEHYFDRYGAEPFAPMKLIATEMSFRIPTGLKTPDGREIFLVGTIDGLAVDPDENLYVLDHKTYSQKMDMKWLQTDHQFSGYSWAMQVLLNQPIAGFIYDGLNKKVPKPPKVLKNGTLSKEWSTSITAHSYKKALKEHYDGDVPWSDYDDLLRRLEERDAQEQTPFFSRHVVRFTQNQLNQWAANTKMILEEIASDPNIYPNFSWTGCWDCGVVDLCRAEQLGDQERLEYVKESSYASGWSSTRSQYKTMLEVTPEEVSSLEDLLKILPSTSKTA